MMSDCSPPSEAVGEPSMVSVAVVGSSGDAAWNSGDSLGSTDLCCGTLGGPPYLDPDSTSDEGPLGVVDNITAHNFLQESDLMNAASTALGHHKSPSGDIDKADDLLSLEHHDDPYHLENAASVALSPSSNSSASSLDLGAPGGMGLPPVSTIIRSSGKNRFDVFCRPSNISLIMGYGSNSFDVMTSIPQRLTASPPTLNSVGHNDTNSLDVNLGEVFFVGSSDQRQTGSGCIKVNSVMSLGHDSTDPLLAPDSEEEGHFDASRTLSFMSPMAIEEMQKVAEISEHLRSSEASFMSHHEDSLLSPPQQHFSPDNYVTRSSTTAIETNVIMSTSNVMDVSSTSKLVADIKAIEQRLSSPPPPLDSPPLEVIIPDCLDNDAQNSDIIYSEVENGKRQNLVRSTIIEKNLLQQPQPPQVIKNEPTVIITSTSESGIVSKASAKVVTTCPQDHQLVTIKKVTISPENHPSAVTASVIQQLLRAQSPKLRTAAQPTSMNQRGVITSVMSAVTKGNCNNLVSSDICNGAKKLTEVAEETAKHSQRTIGNEHSVISHAGGKSPPLPASSSSSSSESSLLPNIGTSVLPSLFSNLSPSALASLSSALPLTLQSTTLAGLCSIENNNQLTTSSPPLSPILLPSSILHTTLRGSSGFLDSSCLLKTTLSLKQEPGFIGSGPLPPFTVVSAGLVKRVGTPTNNLMVGGQPAVVTIKQEPGAPSSSSASSSELINPSILLNPAIQLPVVVTAPSVVVPSEDVKSSAAEQKKMQPQPALSGDPAKPYRCTLCGKHLASKNVYQLHLRSHSGEKPFTCSLCGHHFSQKTSLTRHMRSHTGERPFPCDVCGKRFADKERIKIHMRTHTGEKPFACEVCGKRFSQKSTVKRHMSVHTGEKPFKCDACGKGFANRGNLNAHSKTHAAAAST